MGMWGRGVMWRKGWGCGEGGDVEEGGRMWGKGWGLGEGVMWGRG